MQTFHGIISFLLLNFISSIQCQDYSVLSYGAKGDGKTDDTQAIRTALSAAVETNVGHVIFDANYIFLTGCFNVSSNVILDVRGTILAKNTSDGYVLVEPLPW